MTKKSTLNKGIFTAGVVGAMVAAPYVADELNLTQDTAGEDGFSLADAISMKEAAAFAGGTGTAEDPYLVSTGDDLRAMANDLTAHYKMVNDINLGGVLWTPIGTSSSAPFRGFFDGGGYTISNLTVDATNGYGGFFGYVGIRATSTGAGFKDIKFDNASIKSTNTNARAGVLFAYGVKTTTLENIHVTNSTVQAIGSNGMAGGIFADMFSPNKNPLLAHNLSFEGTVTTTGTHAGGIGASMDLASDYKMSFTNLSVKGTVSSTKSETGTRVGGIFGETGKLVTMENLVSDADVSGYRSVGGLIGSISGSKLIRGIAYGSVSGIDATNSSSIGGVIGQIGADKPKLRLIYAFNENIDVGKTKMVGKIIGENLINAEYYGNAFEVMPGSSDSLNVGDVINQDEVYKKSTYELFGFDFENTWEMVEGSSAPRLKIQEIDTTMNYSQADEERYSFAGGSGTISDPYLVSTVNDVKLMAYNPSSHFKLINNIDLNWVLLSPIGTRDIPFTGSIDGNGYTLSNLNVNTVEAYNGFLGYAGLGFVKNLTIENADSITTDNYAGVLAGYTSDLSISNVKVIGEITVKGGNYVGGLVGYYKNEITHNYDRRYVSNIEVHGTVTGDNYVGGVFGYAEGEKFKDATQVPSVTGVSAHANVTGVDYVGGVIGYQQHLYLADVISYGDVKGDSNVGGISNLLRDTVPLTGAYANNSSTVKNAIAYGSVSGIDEDSKNIGGILGRFDSGNLHNIFAYNSYVGTGENGRMGKALGYDVWGDWYRDSKVMDGIYQFHTVPGDASVGIVDTIVSDEQVKSKAFYTNKTTMDFGGAWIMPEGEHPTLSFAPYTAEHTFTEEEQTGSQFAGGSGSIEDPFLISTPEHLRMVAQNLDSHFKLVNDIDMDWAAWTSDDRIGTSTSLQFSGSFDGNGYAIKNLNIVGSTTNTALFGYVSTTGVIKNLKIKNAEATSTKGYLGILVGQSLGSIQDVEITGDVTMNVTGGDYAGIVAARFLGEYDSATGAGVVKNVYVEGTINGSGKDYLGAFGTFTENANVDTVVADVNVVGAQKVGSFAGNISGEGTYKNIIAKGDVTGDTSAGGYVGYIEDKSTHEKIFAYGTVQGIDTGSVNIGGLVGYAYASGTTIKGMYAMNPSVSIGKAEYVGTAFGRHSKNSSFTPQFVSAINTLASSGHSTHVSTSITASTYNVSSTYTRHGFVFDEADAFAIDAGGAPYLKAFPEQITFNDSTFSFSSLIDENELITAATTAINLAESTLLKADIQAAQIAINAIPDSSQTQKNQLQSLLEGVQVYAVANDAVSYALETLKEGNLDDARVLINKLASASHRNNLNTRLTEVGVIIDEQNLLADSVEIVVLAAEGNPTRASIQTALSAIEPMMESNVKATFLERMSKLTDKLDVVDLVESTVKNLENNVGATNARSLYFDTTNLVTRSSVLIDITPYTPRLAKAYIDIQIAELHEEAVALATNAVVSAENYANVTNVQKAQSAIDLLPNISVKSTLQARLDIVKAKIEGILKATEAVTEVEDTLNQDDYNTAKGLVDSLEAGTDKTNLTNRLNAVLTKMQQAEKIATATVAVEKAEGSKTQADVDSARTLVNALPNGDVKTDLTERLDAVQAEIDANVAIATATEAVEKAEGSKAQEDVNIARTLVNALPSSDEKTALTTRLDAIQTEIDAKAQLESLILDATQAVETAESTKTQTDVDTARQKVNELPDGTDKTVLTERLDAVQVKIDEQGQLEEALEEATQAVVKAEGSKSQTDVDSARTLVNALPDSDEKDALTERLDKIQAGIDAQGQLEEGLEEATQAVVKAEGSKFQTDVDSARTLVNALPDSADKTALTERLDAVQKAIDDAKALEEATQAVVKAEGTKTQADVNTARTLVNALPDGADKTALTERLDSIQVEIDKNASENAELQAAKEAVSKAEGTKTQVDVDNARTLVNALPDSEDKIALTERLDAIQAEIDVQAQLQEALEKATQAVVKAEGSKSQEDVDDARILVNTLPDGADKTALTERLDAIQKAIDDAKTEAEKQQALEEAMEAVMKAEGTKTQADVDVAQDLVNKLPEGADKDALQDRLNKVQAEIDNAKEQQQALQKATEAVVKAEGSKAQEDVDAARTLVNSLPDGADKTALTDRLDKVQAEIDAQTEAQALEKATQAVVKAEGSKEQADVDDARILVNKLKDGADKTALTECLDAIQAEIDAQNEQEEADNALYERIKTEVLGINNSVLNYFIKEAQYAETLVTLQGLREEAQAIKDDAKRNEVNMLIDTVVDLIKLLQAIEAGDTSKIDNLPDSVVKDKLKNDLAQKDLLADATSKVVKAEETLTDSDISDAQAAVNKLKNGTDKQALQKRLDALKSKAENNRALTDATAAVQKAEASPTNFNINSAQNKVNALPDGADKDALQARINAIHEKLWQEALAKATKAVEEAEEMRVTYFINQAKSAVTALKDSPEKDALAKRIADLEKDILTQAELDRAYNFALQAVEKAEGSTLEFLLISAQRAVDKVSDNDTRKAGLQERLDVLYKAKALREVAVAVERAERSPSDTTINNAQALINKLDEGEVRDGYQTRLDAAIKQLDDERYAAAEREVVKSETNKTRAAVEAAQEKLNLVKDSERKTALQERLDAILEWIEYMENLDGKFLPGDNIVDVAKTVKDENVRNYLVEWANSIDVAERYYSNANSAKPANVLTGIPASVLADERYQPLINELKARTDVINKARTEYAPLRAMAVKVAYNVLYDFENDRTQAKYDAALSKINALQTAEKGDNTRKAMLERLNRIEVKK